MHAHCHTGMCVIVSCHVMNMYDQLMGTNYHSYLVCLRFYALAIPVSRFISKVFKIIYTIYRNAIPEMYAMLPQTDSIHVQIWKRQDS